jgi:mannose-1-phosphate guanylyltransferase/mannose-6-phosphate isomerase
MLRCRRSGVFDPRPIVVGADSHRFLLAEDVLGAGMQADILLEPSARNSCAAVAAGCLHALSRAPDAVVLVLAADHHIPDAEAFSDAVVAALPNALSGRLVTFGIRPDRPATGYGYIRPGEPDGQAARVEAFVEKPSDAVARSYLEKGYLWNSGNFMFRADVFLAELHRHQPEVLAHTREAYRLAARDLDFLRLEKEAFAAVPSISIDYAVMEKTDRAAVLPVAYTWSDVGSWDAVAQVLEQDADGNSVVGDASLIGARNNLVHAVGKLVTLIGVEDMVVVDTRDSLLVARKEHSEQVKGLVAQLQQEGRTEANEALQMFRPWGNYERLDIGTGYQVKRIVVKPGGVLSLQKHRHRAEHWVVVQGQAEVTIGDETRTLGPNQSVHVPMGAVHRLANRESKPVVLIEVQSGAYLGEDDIVRLEDNYNRQTVG